MYLMDLVTDLPLHLIAFMIALCVIGGWLLDEPMGDTGFGMIGNSIILSTGAVAVLAALAHLGYRPDRELIISVAGGIGGGAALLILFALLRSRLRG
ncbi:MAG: hypothetical protein MI753_15185 [Hyphomicrobiales bacterium]|nr:hypothetical protein [Hyphomicrobiales bacterium]